MTVIVTTVQAQPKTYRVEVKRSATDFEALYRAVHKVRKHINDYDGEVELEARLERSRTHVYQED